MSSSNPAAPPEPKEIAGRYQIVKKLGAGAFGTVYKAKDSRLDRMVAIKTIRLEGLAASQAGLKEMTDRFQREAKTAAKLKHPGIVTIRSQTSRPVPTTLTSHGCRPGGPRQRRLQVRVRVVLPLRLAQHDRGLQQQAAVLVLRQQVLLTHTRSGGGMTAVGAALGPLGGGYRAPPVVQSWATVATAIAARAA